MGIPLNRGTPITRFNVLMKNLDITSGTDLPQCL